MQIKSLLKEIEQSGDVILFVKEVHHLFDAATSGARSFTYILKHALERGVIQCIFATTENEHRIHMENDMTLKRLFQAVKVLEPSIEETIEILKGLRGTYETHYKLHYTDEALVAAANLSQQYVSDRFLPDKAIDLIDEAGSHVQLCHAKNKKKGNVSIPSVKKHDIQHVVSSWIGVPVSDVSKEEGESLLNLEVMLHKHVIGQNEAISTICRAIRRARVGLRNCRRPIASFMFTGPSGVGKTELANALATNYFGSKDSLIRLDMSEYMDSYNAARLIGAPPGYIGFDEGGQLTESIRKKSHAVLLFDEIEKAHSDVFNLMLQILDDGRLTDGKGQTVDFKSTLIIMTSNLGNSIIEGMIDNKENSSSFDHKKNLVMEELKHHFRPEFLNRLDEIIVFKELTKKEVEEIVNIMLREVCQKLMVKEIHLSLTCRFREHVIQHGYNPSYGARPLRRTIAKFLEDTLAENMLRKEIKEGDSIIVDVNVEGNVVVINQKNVKREEYHFTSFVDSVGNFLADEKRKDVVSGISCNLVGKMLDILGHRKSP
uniref:ATP-dependent Clp protease ATP-binding subunit ClpA homolog CD4A, chloroplastic-like n=1 Tax=Cicer arietinum TaxID=3827 RepID=A0A3Q7XYL1_CICAR|nr:ATP-dependent Clp protease ATP-binding subunit ClpA homolog CD4A, chloroplastic-like [Cicer arietinum]